MVRKADPNALQFIHPGSIGQASGGTIYDRRVIELLRGMGWRVELHELPGRFPLVDAVTADAASALLAAIPDRALVVIDGLALPAFDGALGRHAERLAIAGLIHHPTADETGLSAAESAHLFAIERRLFDLLRRIIVPSPAMARRLEDFAVPAGRIRVVTPGVEPAQRSAGSAGGPVQLLCVASLTPRKGHVALLEALADCCDLDWRLVCAGPSDQSAATEGCVKAAIARLGLGNRVRLAGPQVGHALERLYAAAGVFVLASRYEGYGMVFAEAMVRGLPVVASGAGAVADTVPAAAGVVVPVGERAALVAALRRVIGDPAFRQGKAEGAWQAGRSLPRWADTAAAFAQALSGM
jgi:glycosyltransferase involved in cell wall biosynthesis